MRSSLLVKRFPNVRERSISDEVTQEIQKNIRVNYYLGKFSEMPIISIKNKFRISYPIEDNLCENLLKINQIFDQNDVKIDSSILDLNLSTSSLRKKILSYLNPTKSHDMTSLIFSSLKIIQPNENESFIDEIKSKNEIGSLYIYLPSSYSGGEISLMKNGIELISNIDFSTKEEDLLCLNWIAFHKNCKIKTKPISSGYQMVLIYKIEDEQLKDESFEFDLPSNFSKDLIDFMALKEINQCPILSNDFEGRNFNFPDYWIYKNLVDNWKVDIKKIKILNHRYKGNLLFDHSISHGEYFEGFAFNIQLKKRDAMEKIPSDINFKWKKQQ